MLRSVLAVEGGWLVAGDIGTTDRARMIGKINATGHTVWKRLILRNGASNHGLALATGPTGDIFLAGDDGSPQTVSKPYLGRFDAFGYSTCGLSGVCAGKKVVDCDDKKACTADSCDAVKGCENTVIAGCT